MKTSTKFLIAIGVIFLVVGTIIFTIGLATNSNSKLVTNEYEFNDVENISVNIKTDDLKIIKYSSEKIKVVCIEKEDELHEVKVENNTLLINGFDISKFFKRMFIGFKKTEIKIYLPAASYDNLNIKTATGDVSVPNDFSFNNASITISTGDIIFNANVINDLKISGSTGDVNLANINAKNLYIDISTGDISLSNLSIEDDIKLDFSTGKLMAKNINTKTYSQISSTGDIELNNLIASKSIYIKVSTGNVKLNKCDATESITVITTTGDIIGSLLSNKRFIIKANKYQIPSTNDGGICDLTTTTGRINITIFG